MVEVGARYGTWGARALAAWRQLNPDKRAKFVGVQFLSLHDFNALTKLKGRRRWEQFRNDAEASEGQRNAGGLEAHSSSCGPQGCFFSIYLS
jgi:hypothetical protein